MEKNKVATGKLGDLNEKQQTCLKKLKAKLTEKKVLPNPVFDDWYLLRFCRLKNFSYLGTLSAFNKFVKKTTELDTKNNLNHDLSGIKVLMDSCLMACHTGFDKRGRPVNYIKFGAPDLEL